MKRIFGVALGTLAVLTVTTSASAITAFASFIPGNSDPNIEFNGSASGAGTLSSFAAPVTFRFLDPSGGGLADFAATFNLTATTGAGQVFALDPATQFGLLPVTSGTLSFLAPAMVSYNGRTGVNLLTATFDGGAVVGRIGGSTANYGVSSPPSTVSFTSDFLDFSGSSAFDLALAINAINPRLLIGNTFNGVAQFSGTVAGNFGADGDPAGTGAVIPEPASWAMMIAGFGLVGASARRRRMASVSS